MLNNKYDGVDGDLPLPHNKLQSVQEITKSLFQTLITILSDNDGLDPVLTQDI